MTPARILSIAALCALMLTASTSSPSLAQSKPATRPATTTSRPSGHARWEKQIAEYEEQDRKSPPSRGGIVFIGSSTVRGWKTLAEDFPAHPVINRGFGGSQIVDATHFADRIVFPYEPKMVVLRSGGNDIASGKSAEQVFADYQAFVKKMRSRLPDATIVFIGLAPAPIRWAHRDATKRLNELVEEYTKSQPNLRYVETYDMTVNPDGSPREELFVSDRLHFNEAGYKLLVERVRPALETK